MNSRVVVTGVGVVCAIGNNKEELEDALRSGRSGIAPITAVDATQLASRNGAEVRTPLLPPKLQENSGYVERFSQFLLQAVDEAIEDARISWTDDLRGRTAVQVGCSMGGNICQEAAMSDYYSGRRTRVSGSLLPRAMPNACASLVSMQYGLTGPSFTVTTACASAAHAMGLSFWMVRNGQAQIALTGGTEAPFSLGNLKAWDALKSIDPDTCRPFSRNRNGTVLGEGGAVLVMEAMESALARGAPIYCEVVGCGMSSDASHLTAPCVEGAAKAMRSCLRDAGLEPSDVDYINAHGTGTIANDVTETRAIHEVFGEHASQLSISSTKSMHGHAIGAAGAIEGAVSVLAMKKGFVPPTANFTDIDPECDLDVVQNKARERRVRCVLSNSFAFGGMNAVLAFRECAS